MNNCIHAIDGVYTNDVYYTDTNSLYIESKHWDKLNKAGLVGKKLLQGKNDYGPDSSIFYGLFLAPKKKHCLIINKYGIINEKIASKDLQMFRINWTKKSILKWLMVII